ncbi:MAG: PQQ-binding-like beta-propeller repeat protein, partial [Deltaproteobacteria bacterium]|nr:PQQ-binding-like beta-propeller repeat protein [Deltaproteobacteria bacterium]
MNLLVLAVLVVASSEAAPDPELVAAHTGASLVDVSNRLVFGLRWWRPVVRTGIFREVGTSFGTPAVSVKHGLIIVGSGEGDVRALAVTDGGVRWIYRHGIPFEGAVSLVQHRGSELAVLGSRDGTLLVLEAQSGKLRFKVTLEGDPRAPAVQDSDRLLVTTAANKIAAVALKDGKLLWMRGRPVPSKLTVAGHARPAVGQGRVFATYADGYAEAYDLDDGATLWSRPLSLAGGDFVDADADPVLSGAHLFVASYTDGVYALNPADGHTVWRRAAPAVVALAPYKDLMVVASADGFVWGLGRTDGRVAYRTKLPAGSGSRMTVRDDLVAFSGGDSGLIVLAAKNGRPLQAMGLGSMVASAPAWSGDDLAVLSTSGYVFALRRGSRGGVRRGLGRDRV